MVATVHTFAIDGLEPRHVRVEVDISRGLPAFAIVGLADKAVREARERVRAAVVNSGFEFPQRRITANLAPAHLVKVGPGFDLALALGVLAASGQLDAAEISRAVVYGELSLEGDVRGCRGTLAVAEGARRSHMELMLVAPDRAPEATLVEGLRVAPAANLAEVVEVLSGAAEPRLVPAPAPDADSEAVDLSDVKGHALAIQALEIAAAGGHNALLHGPPGTGKTMLARRLPSILPPLTPGEAVEVTRIHSIAGTREGSALMAMRPFRAPHHTISASGLVGGGARPIPGEATLAHRGVLFLDELAEFNRPALEALRQPLEDGRVAVVRGQRLQLFPCRFMLVAATNPCPCGFGSRDGRCRCGEAELARHRRRLSGALLDRIDLVVFMERPTAEELAGPALASSADVKARVIAARERQAQRLTGTRAVCNAELGDRLLARFAQPSEDARRTLARAYEDSTLSARGHARVLRVARTVADLAGSERVEVEHLVQAIGLRNVAPSLGAAA